MCDPGLFSLTLFGVFLIGFERGDVVCATKEEKENNYAPRGDGLVVLTRLEQTDSVAKELAEQLIGALAAFLCEYN